MTNGTAIDKYLEALDTDRAVGGMVGLGIAREARKEYIEGMHNQVESYVRMIRRQSKERHAELVSFMIHDTRNALRKDISKMYLEALAIQGNAEDARFLVEDYLSMVFPDDMDLLEEVHDQYINGKGITL